MQRILHITKIRSNNAEKYYCHANKHNEILLRVAQI
jgi:hypothetical protein